MLKQFAIIKFVTLFILPYIFLYVLYIQINGEMSPGGGFQAGAIFASMMVALELIYDRNKLEKLIKTDNLVLVASLGLIIYASLGTISFLFNDNYLNYNLLHSNKVFAQSIGIFIVEIGIGLSVSSALYLIYRTFHQVR
jgi:multicomponent Na+:H+ antiporter subunit B